MSTSTGQKVTPSGANPPTTHEATGIVAPDSLAAESLTSGGEFASNKKIHAPSTTSPNLTSTTPHETPADVAAAATKNKGVDKAPTYVNTVLGSAAAEGQEKVKGKGVTEDTEMIGRPAGFEGVEKAVGNSGQVAGGGAVGGGDGERGGKFDALGRSEEA